MTPRAAAGRWQRAVARHPRLWGVALAALLFVAYTWGLRPARWWAAEHVARPVLAALDTPRARQFALVRIERRPDAIFAVDRAVASAAAGDDAALDAHIRADEPPQWAAPVGVLFLLPGLFLIALFPDRPYWLWLLAYHVALGAVAFAAFAVGLAAWAPAFKLHTFARTYLAETVSLAVPLLLALAARAGRDAAPGGDAPGARLSSPDARPPAA